MLKHRFDFNVTDMVTGVAKKENPPKSWTTGDNHCL